MHTNYGRLQVRERGKYAGGDWDKALQNHQSPPSWVATAHVFLHIQFNQSHELEEVWSWRCVTDE